ncbi:hypothetical protein TIFTF001_017777 [Ficus carica]|uniref:BED-type domain-containing protein n=1 Tax=Ficus carica TaxID=3494 RepID=A0AA88A9W0_FICCA|nr:hypothetical protein TIFTF001_017777 [Ficus carica]
MRTKTKLPQKSRDQSRRRLSLFSLPLNLILSFSLELDHSEGDSLLSHAIASGRASYHHVDIRDKSLLTKDVPIDEDKEEELEVISKDATGKAKRKRRTTSIVWSHFDKLPLSEDKRLRAKCKECGSVYLANSKNGTGSMRRHMISCQRKDTCDIGQLLISQEKGSLAVSAKRFDPEHFRELITTAIMI